MSQEELTQTKTLTPENFAQRCPVCNGHGDLNYGKKICHGCKGKGYLILPVKSEEGEKKQCRQPR